VLENQRGVELDQKRNAEFIGHLCPGGAEERCAFEDDVGPAPFEAPFEDGPQLLVVEHPSNLASDEPRLADGLGEALQAPCGCTDRITGWDVLQWKVELGGLLPQPAGQRRSHERDLVPECGQGRRECADVK